tara:strand:- start:2953 stop:3330 length:378 start_codon:yes stop_codon:yes gene_type:complete
MNKRILTEMPHLSGIVCPHCGFKFTADLRVEDWTDDMKENQKYYRTLLGVHQIPFTCPNCTNLDIHDLETGETFKYKDIEPTLDPAIREFFKTVLGFLNPVFKNKANILAEEKLSFGTFVNAIDD